VITDPRAKRGTIGSMNDKTIETIRRQIRLAFMAAVTATMLALTFEHARRGLPGAPNAVVYALTVGFGLEFLGATWKSRWVGQGSSATR
jgi:hypothetical protein